MRQQQRFMNVVILGVKFSILTLTQPWCRNTIAVTLRLEGSRDVSVLAGTSVLTLRGSKIPCHKTSASTGWMMTLEGISERRLSVRLGAALAAVDFYCRHSVQWPLVPSGSELYRPGKCQTCQDRNVDSLHKEEHCSVGLKGDILRLIAPQRDAEKAFFIFLKLCPLPLF